MTAQQKRGGVLLMLLIGLVLMTGGLGAQPTEAPAGQPVPTVEVPGKPPEPPAADEPSQPAVPTQEVPSPAAPDHWPEQGMWALVASYAYQYLKKTKWFTFINEDTTARVQAQFGFVMAVLTAAGVHFAVDGEFFGSGASFTVTGLSWTVVKDVAFQWASQQGWYDLLVHKRDAVRARPVAV